MKNLIIIPPHYSGTSFEDIVQGLKIATRKLKIKVKLFGYTKPLNNKVPNGTLDDLSYVRGQIKLLEKIITLHHTRRILFLDFFNPGLDILKYFYTQQKISCTFGALLHGGSFFPDDLYSWPWLKNLESAWTGIYDRIYAPSRFLLNQCPQSLKQKIKVFPWGMDAYQHTPKSKRKSYDVVFPHRLNKDKGIEDFLTMVSKLPDVRFAVTTPQSFETMKQNPYYRLLNRHGNIVFIFGQSQRLHLQTLSQSRVVLSCAKQENFGYAVMKSVLCGCVPVLPNRLCYPNFFPKKFLYANHQEAIYLILHYLNQESNQTNIECLTKEMAHFSFVPLLQDFLGK